MEMEMEKWVNDVRLLKKMRRPENESRRRENVVCWILRLKSNGLNELGPSISE